MSTEDPRREQALALIADGRRQATEGWERQWAFRTSAGITIPVSEDDALRYEAWNVQQHALGLPAGEVLARLVGPWEPVEQPPVVVHRCPPGDAALMPCCGRTPFEVSMDRMTEDDALVTCAEHYFEESSVIDPETGQPHLGSSGPTPYEPPDPRCICGAHWEANGCATQQPGWTPPAPYDGPTLDELLSTVAEQPEARHESFTMLPCDKIDGPHPKHTWSHRDEPCEGHVCPGAPVAWPAEQPEGGAR